MLQGQHAVITGGSGGVGLAAARALAAAGASLTLLGRSSETLTTAAARLVSEIDTDILTIVCDITQPIMFQQAIEHANSTLGAASIVVHAARPPLRELTGAFLQGSPERWQKAWETRVMGATHAVRLMAPAMMAAGRGRFIMVGSTGALNGHAGASAEGVADHGLLGLVRHLAVEWLATPLAINYLALGQVATDALQDEIDDLATRNRRPVNAIADEFARSNPQGKLIDQAAVGRTIVWLCEPTAQSLTGQVIGLTGGYVF